MYQCSFVSPGGYCIHKKVTDSMLLVNCRIDGTRKNTRSVLWVPVLYCYKTDLVSCTVWHKRGFGGHSLGPLLFQLVCSLFGHFGLFVVEQFCIVLREMATAAGEDDALVCGYVFRYA